MTATLFPFKPGLPYKHTIEWMSDIMPSYDGHEQRVRVRHAPRNIFDLNVFGKSAEASARIRAFLALHQADMVGYPAWHDAIVTAGVGSGETVVAADTTESEFHAGANAVLWEDDETCEFLEIDAVDDDQITLSTPTTQAYTAGSLIIPMHEGYLDNRILFDDLTSEVSQFSLKITGTNSEMLESTHWSSQAYLGSRVMDDPLLLNNGRSVPRSLGRAMDFVDYGTGAVQVFDRSGFSVHGLESWRWSFSSRTSIWAFRKWLAYMAGQINTVWIPSQTRDIYLSGAFLAGDTTLFISPYGYVEDESFSHLAFIKTDGTILCRAVTGWSANTVSIDSGLGFIGSMADFDRISFLRLYRLVTDSVVLEWESQSRLESTFGMKTVYDEESG